MQRTRKKKKQPKVLNTLLIIVFLLNIYFTYTIGITFHLVTIFFTLITVIALYSKSKFLKFILLIIFLISSTFTGFTGFLISSLTQKDEVVTSYLITLKDNPVNNIKDIDSNEKIAMQSPDSVQGYQMYDKYFKNKGFDFSYQEYSSYLLAANDLYTGNINYVVIDSLQNEQLNQYYPGFQSEIKVIDKIESKAKVKSTNKNVKKESTNILLTGGDSRDGSLSGRSDTIMIATINPDTNKLLLSSIPRDSYVFNSCTGYNDKVTHVSNGGINCLISTLESELTTSIDYYAKINFESIISVVDSVGGITIDVDQSFCAQDENDVADAYCFEQGTANLNGSQALAYSRERKSFSDGDKTRVFHQQQVVAGILTEVKTASFSEINTIIGSVGDYVATNMSTTQISNLAQLFQNTDNISYESQILETTGDYADIPQLGLYSTSVQIIDESSRQEVSSKISFVLNE